MLFWKHGESLQIWLDGAEEGGSHELVLLLHIVQSFQTPRQLLLPLLLQHLPLLLLPLLLQHLGLGV